MRGELSEKQLSVDQAKGNLTERETQRGNMIAELDSVRAALSSLQANVAARNAVAALVNQDPPPTASALTSTCPAFLARRYAAGGPGSASSASRR